MVNSVAVWANTTGTLLDDTDVFINGGNLGLGTATPSYKIDVVDGDIRITGSGAQAYRLARGVVESIWQNGVDISYFGTLTNHPLGLLVANEERVRIDTSGNVGIGTIPSYKLHVNGNSYFEDSLLFGAGTNASISWTSGFSDGVTLTLYGPNSGSVYIRPNASTDGIFLRSNGRVGVGTTAPSGKFGVQGTNSDVGFNAGLTGSPERGNIYYNTDGTGWKLNIGKFQSSTFTSQMTFVDDGNVGIDTTTPAYRLQVRRSGGAGSLGISIDNAVSARTVQYYAVGDSTSDQTAHAFYTRNGSATDVLRLAIDAAGNVGVGTTTMHGRLNVLAAASSIYGSFDAPTSGFAYHAYRTNGTVYGYIGQGNALISSAAATDMAIRGEFGTILFGIGSAEAVRINSALNVGVGTSSPTTKLDVAGGISTRNTRVSNIQVVPVGHYTPGETVFEIDPTWTQAQLQSYFNSSNVTWVADSTAPGGYAISIAGSTDVAGVYSSGFPYIPVDQDDVFMMEVWIRNVSGTNTHYMGSVDYDHNLNSLGGNPGSFGYWVMSNTNPGTSWVKYTGYIGGFGTSTGQFVAGTKYWTPQALFNYTGGGTTYISGWKATKVTSRGNKVILSGSLGVGTPTLKTYTGFNTITLGNNGNGGLLAFRSSYNAGDGAELYQDSTGIIRLNVNSGLNALVISNTGNVGAGTTTPTYRLQSTVASSANADIFLAGMVGVTNGFTVRRVSSVFEARLATGNWYVDSGNVSINGAPLNQALNVNGNIELNTGANRYVQIGSVSNFYWRLQASGDDFQIAEGTGTPVRMHFQYNTGYVGIGTTSPNAPVHAVGGASMTSGWNRTAVLQATYPVLVFNSNSTRWAGIAYDNSAGMRFYLNATTDDVIVAGPAVSILNSGFVGIGISTPTERLHVSGGIRATDYTLSSDLTLKEYVVPITDALDIVRLVEPIHYRHIVNGRFEVGFGAQHLRDTKYGEQLTTIGQDGLYGVLYDRTIPVLWQAVREQDGEVTALKRRFERLTKRLGMDDDV